MICKPIERPTEETANFIHYNGPYHLERRGAAGGTILAVTSVYGIVNPFRNRSILERFRNGSNTDLSTKCQHRGIGRHQNLNVLH